MDNLNDIIKSLSPDDIDMLKGVASSILGSQQEETPEPKTKMQKNQDNSQNLMPAGLGLDNIDFEMIMKAKTLFEKMNNTPSKNADLIMALKPHLSPQTQNKADQAMRIIKLFEVLPLLRGLF